MFVSFPPAVDSDSECEQGAGAAEGSRPPWRSVLIGEQEHRIDMASIEPYKRVVSHGGSPCFCLLYALTDHID